MDAHNPNSPENPPVAPSVTPSTGYAPNNPLSPQAPTPVQTPEGSGGEPISPKVQTHLDNNPHANDPIKPHHTKKFYTMLILAIVVILAIIGSVLGYFFFIKDDSSKSDTAKQIVVPTVAVSPTEMPDPTVGWTVFSGNGFTFKYSSDSAKAEAKSSNKNSDIQILSNNGGVLLIDIDPSNTGIDAVRESSIVVANQSIQKSYQSDTFAMTSEIVDATNGKIRFEYQLSKSTAAEDDDMLFDTILSTFSLVSEDSATITGETMMPAE